MTNVVDDAAWLAARRELLELEKDFQTARDALAAKRRQLPLREIAADYEFASEQGTRSLQDLFGNHSQLLVYHFMFHPDWDEGCKSCSFWADSFDNAIAHLGARDVAFAVISRAPLNKLLAYQQRMEWSFPWLSSADNSFNYDFGVSFSEQQIEQQDTQYNYRDGANVGPEMPGLSVFQRAENDVIYHSYSTFARGLDNLNPVYQLLDLTRKGRDESELPYPMDWVRRHDQYQS